MLLYVVNKSYLFILFWNKFKSITAKRRSNLIDHRSVNNKTFHSERPLPEHPFTTCSFLYTRSNYSILSLANIKTH